MDDIAGISVTQQANFTHSLSLWYLLHWRLTTTTDGLNQPIKTVYFAASRNGKAIDVKIGALLPTGVIEYKGVGRFYQYSGGWKTGNNGMTIQWDLVDIIGTYSRQANIPPTRCQLRRRDGYRLLSGNSALILRVFILIEALAQYHRTTAEM